MPSEKESFGLSALEAMASSVPVVSSDAGGLPELIENGKSGYICKIGDVEDMSKKSLEILDDKNLKVFKDNAFMRAKIYDIEKVLPEYIKMYKGVIK